MIRGFFERRETPRGDDRRGFVCATVLVNSRYLASHNFKLFVDTGGDCTVLCIRDAHCLLGESALSDVLRGPTRIVTTVAGTPARFCYVPATVTLVDSSGDIGEPHNIELEIPCLPSGTTVAEFVSNYPLQCSVLGRDVLRHYNMDWKPQEGWLIFERATPHV